MILGMSTATYTLLHVLISLIGIGSGFIVLLRVLHRQAARSLEFDFSGHHRGDQRHRLRFPIRPSPALAQAWYSVACGAGDCDSGAIRVSSCGCVAQDVRHHRVDRALLQRFRASCAILHEGSAASRSGSDAARAAIPDCTTCCFANFYWPYDRRGQEIPQRAGTTGKSGLISNFFVATVASAKPRITCLERIHPCRFDQ